jgi:L-seryl-tRNA(Ser) seleniumtransferase
MTNKPSDLFSSIPSVSELLDKPPVRALVDRWNRSAVAAGVRSFLDQLTSDLQRRAVEVSLPSVRELAERAARYIQQLQQQSVRPAINATGGLRGARWVGAPLADVALQRVIAVGRQFAIGTARDANILAEADTLLCRLSGGQAATAVHSYAGAVWIALAAIAGGEEVVVSRAELGDLDPGCTLARLAVSSGATIREVGTINRTSAADYDAAISPRTAALMKLTSDDYRVVGQTVSAELEELVDLARERELALIDVAGASPLVDLPATVGAIGRSVRASLKAGVDLVIVRGDGLVGGPPCGIVIGQRELVRRIEEHPLFMAWRLDALSAAALAATVELHENDQRLAQELPVMQLLLAPLENLRNRAERLAPQLAQAEAVRSAEAVATESLLGVSTLAGQALPSHGVALVPADDDVAGLDKRLSTGPVAVIGRRERDRLVLDLRTVFPREDQVLVEAVVGNKTAAFAPQSETPAQ